MNDKDDPEQSISFAPPGGGGAAASSSSASTHEKVDQLPVKRGSGSYSITSFQDHVKFERGVPYFMYKRREELEDDTPTPTAGDKEEAGQKKRRPPKAMYTWVFHDGLGSEAGGIHMEGGEVSRGPESTFIIMQYDKHEKVCYATPVRDWVNLSRMKIPKSAVLSAEEVEEAMKRKSSKAKPKKALLSQRERVEELLAKLVKDEDDRDEGPAGKGGKGKGSIKRERNDDGTSGTFKPMEKDEGEGQESVMLEGLAQDEDDRKLLGLDDEGADYEQEFDDDDVDATDENNAMIHHEVETEGEEEEDEEDEEEEEEEGVGQKEAEAVEAEAPPQAGGKRPLEEAAGEGAARPQKMGRTSMFAPGSVEGQMRDLMLAKVKISSKDLSRHLVQIVQTTTGITDKAQVRTLAKNTTDKLCLKEFDKVTGQPYFILKPQYTKDDAT